MQLKGVFGWYPEWNHHYFNGGEENDDKSKNNKKIYENNDRKNDKYKINEEKWIDKAVSALNNLVIYGKSFKKVSNREKTIKNIEIEGKFIYYLQM